MINCMMVGEFYARMFFRNWFDFMGKRTREFMSVPMRVCLMRKTLFKAIVPSNLFEHIRNILDIETLIYRLSIKSALLSMFPDIMCYGSLY